MSRRVLSSVVLAGAVLLGACADRAPVLPVTRLDPSDAVGIDRLLEMGFARQNIVDAGDRFVVEGDIVFPKAALTGPVANRMAVPGPRGQWKVTTPILQSEMRNGILINLSGISSNSAWLTAMRAAMSDWEWLSGTNTIKFIESTASGAMPVTFGNPQTNPNALAETGYPVSGYPGGGVVIKNNSTSAGLSAAQKRWMMVHELGHAIGLRHSNWQALGDQVGTVGADSVPNTPTSDANSVMYGTYTTYPSFSGFSQYDKVAAEYMYPATVPTITSTGYDSSGRPTFSWSSVTYATGYKVRFDGLTVEWIEDSSRYEGGYWATSATNGDLATTASTSYTDPYSSYTGDDWCLWRYQVWTIYPSGKWVGPAMTSYFPVCGPFPS